MVQESMKTKIPLLFLSFLALSACVHKRDIRHELEDRWVGKAFDSFVSRYGEPHNEYLLSGGDTAYLWNPGTGTMDAPDYAISRLYGDYSYKKFPGAGNINLMCEVQIVVDEDGIIGAFTVMRDTMGTRIDSRCREVLGRN